jgi:hypothetical protein
MDSSIVFTAYFSKKNRQLLERMPAAFDALYPVLFCILATLMFGKNFFQPPRFIP